VVELHAQSSIAAHEVVAVGTSSVHQLDHPAGCDRPDCDPGLTLRRQQCGAAIVHAGEAARVLRRIRQLRRRRKRRRSRSRSTRGQRRCRSKPHQRPAGNACAIGDLERGVTCSDFAHSMRSLIHAASLRTSLRSRSCGAIHKLSVWPLSMNPNGATSCPESISFSTRYLGVSATPN